MANKKFSDFADNPDTVLTTPAPSDLVLIWDNSEPLDINRVKVITFQNLVNLAAQSVLQALVSGQTAGDTFYANSATALARLAKGTTGQSLIQGTSAPYWGEQRTIKNTQVAGDIFYATAPDALAKLAIGTAGQVLRVNSGATAPEWGGAIIKRQGGSATAWATPGTTTYSPSASKIQVGSIAITLTDDDDQVYVTFPEAFTYTPLILCSFSGGTGTSYVKPVVAYATSVTNSGAYLNIKASGVSNYTFYVNWIAIGI